MKTEMVEFIREKITEVEKSISCREQIQKVFIGGTNESWKRAASMHPSTGGSPMSKEERMKTAVAQGRILTRLRHELKMLNAVLEEMETA